MWCWYTGVGIYKLCEKTPHIEQETDEVRAHCA
jgi:hypothetical protein